MGSNRTVGVVLQLGQFVSVSAAMYSKSIGFVRFQQETGNVC